MTACLAPTCVAEILALGDWWFLCVDHAIEAHVSSTSTKAPERPDLRGRCWGDALTCLRPAVTLGPHGGYCAEHAKPPKPVPAPRDSASLPDAERVEQLATLAVLNAFQGAQVEIRPNLRAPQFEGTAKPLSLKYLYGPTEDVPPAEISRGVKILANAAKAGKWDLTVKRAQRYDRVALRAWRGRFLLLALWDDGSFAGAWLQGGGQTLDLNAGQAAKLLRAAP